MKCATSMFCVYIQSTVCLCVSCGHLVDYVLPIFDEGESALATVCILSEVEGSCSSPQIQLPQRFSDCHFCLSTTVQVLNASTHTHIHTLARWLVFTHPLITIFLICQIVNMQIFCVVCQWYKMRETPLHVVIWNFIDQLSLPNSLIIKCY